MSEELKVYEEKMEKSIDALLNEYAQDVRTRMYLTRSKWITTEHRHRSSRSEISPFRRQE